MQATEITKKFSAAVALHQQGQLAQAAALYQEIVTQAPRHFDTLHLYGVLEAQRKNLDSAVTLIGQALAIDQSFAPAHLNMGNALLELDRCGEALACYDRALVRAPDSPDALYSRGLALARLGRREEALVSYDRALALKPDYAEAVNSRGNTFIELKRYEDALASYDRTLLIKPDYPDAMYNRGNALRGLKRHEEAVQTFEQLLHLAPGYAYARGCLLSSSLHCCNWTDYDRNVALIVSEVAEGKPVADPFSFLAVVDTPCAQLRCTRAYNKNKFPAVAPLVATTKTDHHDRIRIAYLSADFHSHATAYLMAGLVEAHDRSRFETTALSFGPDNDDKMRTRLENAFDHFIDVAHKSDHEVALHLQEQAIDIAVDLKGYTLDSRPKILSWRPAPIQVNYLGYPGTMAADYIDYIIADRFVIPPDQRQFYSEKVVYLPDTYQVNDDKRTISDRTPTRHMVGLPQSGFIFCSFNNNYKITPPVFEVWMRLLRGVEGSVLWLLEDNSVAVRNLRLGAGKHGVAPERLVFAPRVALAEHLARHRLADLFLDTLPVNAHTTASDALWAGLPVVTCAGRSFAGRVAGSLLHAVGLDDLITDNLVHYEALALKLARDSNTLAAVRTRLAQNRESFPLFDTDRFRRHIESAYEMMWERHRRGEPPADFAVPPAPHR